jgi:uroporphyrinogen decarboxylase
MTRYQRCMKALSGGVPDRPPISFDISPQNNSGNINQVYKHFGASDKNDLYRVAGIDGFSVWEWNAVMGSYIGKAKYAVDGTKLDFWGNAYPGHFGLFECDTSEAVKSHSWPRLEDFDFSNVTAQSQKIHSMDMPVAAGHLSLGYQMHNTLRGNEKALMDGADPDYMETFMAYLTEFTCAYIEKLLYSAGGLIDVVRADDDLGTMDRLMISPQTWRTWYKPAWKRAFDIVHRYGAKVWFHSCGYIMPLMDDLIEIGVDCWNPFPPYVHGNDHQRLKTYRKGRLVLDGGISHMILVNGSPQQVHDETRRVLDLFASDGGLLIGPSQVITADMPVKNIITMFDTARIGKI